MRTQEEWGGKYDDDDDFDDDNSDDLYIMLMWRLFVCHVSSSSNFFPNFRQKEYDS